MNNDVLAHRIFQGDCLDILPTLPSCSVNLIVTSPPYADQRKDTYGGVHPDKYVEWFLPVAAELKRVLKQEGSFILNIKERVVDSERHTYVLELILALRKQGWLWTEEYIWHKRNSYPGKWPNRFRDGWERCLHFTKDKHFAMYQDAVRVPMGDWSQSRLRNLSETDKRRDNSHVQSGFGKKIANWVGRDLAYPDNVLHMATECSNRGHGTTFPVELPVWFIKLFTQPGDLVLDPFLGSGTTSVAAKQLGRRSIGIEMNSDYFQVAQGRMESTGVEFPPSLLTDVSKPPSKQASPDEDQQLLSHYQDALAYALGQLGAFDLLSAMDIPQERKRFWRVIAMMGYLNAEHTFKKSVLQIVQGAFNSEELSAFLTLVSTLLQEHMGMSQADADFALQHFDSYYFDRWGPPIMSWSQCRDTG